MRVVHLTSAHRRHDVRIFLKECRALAAFHDVSLVVADGLGEEVRDGVTIIDSGAKSTRRLKRMLRAPWQVLAASPDADVYHLHDPELIPAGLVLKRRGKTVIFDSHEDLPRSLLGKPYLPSIVRKLLSPIVDVLETAALRRFDAVVTVTAHIGDRFRRAAIPVTEVCNFPIASEINPADWRGKEPIACYIGVLSKVRGADELPATAELLSHGRIVVAGGKLPDAQNLDCLGFVDRAGVQSVLDRAMVGIVTLHPTSAYLPSLPVKMFEYMAAGIPVVASDFPLWRQIITDAQCGLLVDPLDPKAIAAAIDFLLANPVQAEIMGRNGRQAVESRYNWAGEARKLRDFYAAVHPAPLSAAA